MRFIELPARVEQEISSAVEKFVQEIRVETEGVDAVSFYHDEPIWFIRSVSRLGDGETLVRRLQIASFEPHSPSELPTLHILPDVYKHSGPERSAQRGTLVRLVKPDWVTANAKTVEIYQTSARRGAGLGVKSAKQLQQAIKDALKHTWKAVNSAPVD